MCAVKHAEAVVHKLYMYSQINHSQTVAPKSREKRKAFGIGPGIVNQTIHNFLVCTSQLHLYCNRSAKHCPLV